MSNHSDNNNTNHPSCHSFSTLSSDNTGSSIMSSSATTEGNVVVCSPQVVLQVASNQATQVCAKAPTTKQRTTTTASSASTNTATTTATTATVKCNNREDEESSYTTTSDDDDALEAARAMMALTTPTQPLVEAILLANNNNNRNNKSKAASNVIDNNDNDNDDCFDRQVKSLHRAFLAVISWCLSLASSSSSSSTTTCSNDNKVDDEKQQDNNNNKLIALQLVTCALNLTRRAHVLSLPLHVPLYQWLATNVARYGRDDCNAIDEDDADDTNVTTATAMASASSNSIMEIANMATSLLDMSSLQQSSFFSDAMLALVERNMFVQAMQLRTAIQRQYHVQQQQQFDLTVEEKLVQLLLSSSSSSSSGRYSEETDGDKAAIVVEKEEEQARQKLLECSRQSVRIQRRQQLWKQSLHEAAIAQMMVRAAHHYDQEWQHRTVDSDDDDDDDEVETDSDNDDSSSSEKDEDSDDDSYDDDDDDVHALDLDSHLWKEWMELEPEDERELMALLRQFHRSRGSKKGGNSFFLTLALQALQDGTAATDDDVNDDWNIKSIAIRNARSTPDEDEDDDEENDTIVKEMVYLRDSHSWMLPDVTMQLVRLNNGHDVLYTRDYEAMILRQVMDNHGDKDDDNDVIF